MTATLATPSRDAREAVTPTLSLAPVAGTVRIVTRLADEVLSAYFKRYGDAEKAYQQDPLTHAHTKWLNRTITMMDIAMDDEGVPEETRLRVLRMVVYGSTGDPDAALERIADHEEQVRKLMVSTDPLCLPSPAWSPLPRESRG